VKPRPGDVIGAALLTIVLFTLVAVIFVSALGEPRDDSESHAGPGRAAASVPSVASVATVASWQL
jgi:hypothetical protein